MSPASSVFASIFAVLSRQPPSQTINSMDLKIRGRERAHRRKKEKKQHISTRKDVERKDVRFLSLLYDFLHALKRNYGGGSRLVLSTVGSEFMTRTHDARNSPCF